MDATRVKFAAEQIERAQAALGWLEKYRESVERDGGTKLEFRFIVAASCPGADDAKAMVERAAKAMMEEVFARAVTDCESVIRDQLSIIAVELYQPSGRLSPNPLRCTS